MLLTVETGFKEEGRKEERKKERNVARNIGEYSRVDTGNSLIFR